MKFFKLNPSLKGLDEMVPTGGIKLPHLPSQKVWPRVLAMNSKPLLMTNNEMK
jgi:hypothetical protein